MLFWFNTQTILVRMKRKALEKTHHSAPALFVIYLVAIVGAATSLPSLRDSTHELQRVGAAWLWDSAILYVQAWSHSSPQTLFFAGLYDRIASSSFLAILIEIVVMTCAAALAFQIVSRLLKNRIRDQQAVLLLAAATTLIPGVWQPGITTGKLGLLFGLVAYAGYLLWCASGPSQSIFGPTKRNWRWLLFAGVGVALLLHTSLFFAIFTLPLLADIMYRHVRMAGLVMIPPVLLSVVWLSVVIPHGIVHHAWQAYVLDLQFFTHESGFFSYAWPLLLPTALVAAMALVQAEGSYFRRNLLAWLLALVIVLSVFFAPAGILQSITLCVILCAFLYTPRTRQIVGARYMIVAAGLVLLTSVPARLMLESKLKQDRAEANAAAVYVEQRLITSRDVYYYGAAAGFYDLYHFHNPTRFFDATIFSYDTPSYGLVDAFRGDMEAKPPRYIVVATGERTRIKRPNMRLEEYFTKHYALAAELPGYKILKRK